MKTSVICLIAGLGWMVWPAASPSAGTPLRQPNIVFILADDLGYGDVRCYNPDTKIPTPHLVLIDHPTGDDNGEPEWFKRQRAYLSHIQPGELFNLRQDLPERTNLYAQRPEVVRELKELLERYKREGRSTPGRPLKSVAGDTAGKIGAMSWTSRNTVSGE